MSELEKQLEALKAQNADLKAQVEALEKAQASAPIVKLDKRLQQKLDAGLSLEQATIAVAEQDKADALQKRK